MLVTLTYTGPSATDLGFLLHKNPETAHVFDLSVGRAHVFYPVADDAQCTAALMLEIDPIELVRSKRFRGSGDGTLAHYVNDRPYASGSMMATAVGAVFRTAMTGRSDARPDLAANPMPLAIELSAVPVRGPVDLAARLFEPLGWQVTATELPLDDAFPEWGPSPYQAIRLEGTVRLADALRHLYVLLPVLDDAKHYWVSDDEVGKLLRAGEGWLAGHPERELITQRYLKHQRSYIDDAATRLAEADGVPALAAEGPVTPEAADAAGPAAGDDRAPLNRVRAEVVLGILRELGARRVADLGCGPGALLRPLLDDRAYVEIVGTDVSAGALAVAAERLQLGRLSDAQQGRVRLLQSSVTYQDDRIAGLDAVVLMEVIEHIDPERHAAVERAVFVAARPAAVIVTTPNREYNELYPSLSAGAMRHPDHRFEWSRGEFRSWATGVAGRTGYSVEFRDVGDVDERRGSPTQLALFRREDA
ncbi:3' terminal RNA ribose 2'-O-methyltransferase Hen1 [Leifsonia poae]|uniref:Small RNA 2'-O-methyltransferase n=1 Tax=Leifsonia poae TaxID=110933 RepID=A0A9W6HD86_9MICO|nr:3' terminal RNA ribose 2'-O-methyltransferase Hen1 [Leifsonia poae]GLJ78172.1 3' terminal RNA ribose 2'-O-methyltransferase Hen1 [Leifsonia poae]